MEDTILMTQEVIQAAIGHIGLNPQEIVLVTIYLILIF